MELSSMRRMDSWAGIPICLALDMVARISMIMRRIMRVGGQKEISEPRTILAMKFLGIGSILLASPALHALRRSFPEARLLFATFDKNKEVPELLRLADDLVIIRTSSLWFFAVDVARAVIHLRMKRPEITLDLEFFSKFSLIFAYLVGSPRRVGYSLRERWRSGPMLTHKVPFNPYRHITEIFHALVQAAGAKHEIPPDPPLPHYGEEAKERIISILEGARPKAGQKLVVINPNSGEMALQRRWPAERFQRLAQWLIEQKDALVVFIGSKEEAPYVETISRETRSEGNRVLDLSGRLNLGELSALLHLADLLVTNDSGPLHLAVLMGTPTVSLFGPESPQLYGPLGPNHRVLYKGLYCSPCLSVYNTKETGCSDNKCLKEISLEEVMAATEEILSHSSNAKSGQSEGLM
jgi:ADP-heptose:LPS heptosyltransferase